MSVRADHTLSDTISFGHYINGQCPKRFIEAAKEAGADETEAGADRAFKEAVKTPQKGEKKSHS